MAKTETRSIRNMAAGEVADETREWFRVTSDEEVLAAVERWEAYAEYQADIPAWVLANGNAVPPPFAEFAAVADPDNVAMREKVFVELRFFSVNELGEDPLPVNAPWVQINNTNTPGLSASFLGDLLKIFDARRAYTGLAPV